MKVSNAVYEKVTIAWGDITFPLKEGTPVSANGAVANSEDAFGIVPQAYAQEPLMKSIYVLVGGHADLDEIETLYGSSYDDAAIESLSGFHFYRDGAALQNAVELPSVTTDDNGDVLTVVSGAWAKATPSGGGGVEFINSTHSDDVYTLDKTYNEISAMVEGGKLPVIISAGDSRTEIGFVTLYYTYTEDETTAYFVSDSGGLEYVADSADGTLTYEDAGSH